MLLGFCQDGNAVLLFVCSVCEIACYEIIFCAKIRIVCESKEDERTEVASGQRLI